MKVNKRKSPTELGYYLAKWKPDEKPSGYNHPKIVIGEYRGLDAGSRYSLLYLRSPGDGWWLYRFEWFYGPFDSRAKAESTSFSAVDGLDLNAYENKGEEEVTPIPPSPPQPELSLPSLSTVASEIDKALEANKKDLAKRISVELQKGSRSFRYEVATKNIIPALRDWVNSHEGYRAWKLDCYDPTMYISIKDPNKPPWKWPRFLRWLFGG